MQDSLGIHYDNLGLYKELLHLTENKAWRINELVTLTIHLAKVTEDVIEVLAINILLPFSKQRHNHVQEVRTSILGKMTDSNLVDLLVKFNSGLKRDDGSKARKRKNSDTKNRFLDVVSALPLVAMLSRREVCILLNGLTIPSSRINVRIWWAGVIKDKGLEKVGQREHTPR
jgi:hypothetical protein